MAKGLKLSPEQVEAHRKKHPYPVKATLEEIKRFAERDNDVAQFAPQPKVKRRRMNKTEAEFGVFLEAQRTRGEIVRYEFEGIRLKWGVDPETGEAMFYKPDWFVVAAASHGSPRRGLYCIEVKGAHIWDRDIVRFKGARAAWPEFEFQMWQKKGGAWNQIH